MLTRRVIAGTVVGLALLLALTAPALGVTTFYDVRATDPYYESITQLAARDMIGGFAGGRFGADDPLTRQQFAKMLVKTMGYRVTGYETNPFSDVQPAPAGALDPFYPDKYVAVCYQLGLLAPRTANTFGALDRMSRAELAAAAARALNLPDPPVMYSPPFRRFAGTDYSRARAAAYAGLLDGLENLGPGFDLLQIASRGESAQVLYNLLVLKEGETAATTATTAAPSPPETQPGGQTGTVTTAGPGSTTAVTRRIDAPQPEPGISWTSPVVISGGAIALAAFLVAFLLVVRPRAARRRLLTAEGPSDGAAVQTTPSEQVEEVLHKWAEARAESPVVPVTEENVEDAQAWDHLLASRLSAEAGSGSSAEAAQDAPGAKTGRSRLRRSKHSRL